MKNKKLFNAIVKISLLSTILAMSFTVLPVKAAALTSLSDTMTRLTISTAANHDIAFTTTTAVAAGETIEIRFDPTTNAFAIPSLVVGDMTATGMTLDDTCAGAGTDRVTTTVVNAGPADTITFTVCAGDTVPAGPITLALGNNHVTNPGSAGSYQISIGGTMTDSGTLAVAIVDSDEVTITATIDPSLTFDLDTYATAAAFPTNTETAAPYTVALGSLTIGGVKGSNGGGGINSIWVDLSTNATGGAVVTVRDIGTGAAAGLYASSVSHNIPSSTTLLDGTAEGYGVCVKDAAASSGTLQGLAPYVAGCAYATHNVGALALTTTDILNSAGAPLNAGRAEILVKAAATSLTPAAVDYEDTMTFIATGTF